MVNRSSTCTSSKPVGIEDLGRNVVTEKQKKGKTHLNERRLLKVFFVILGVDFKDKFSFLFSPFDPIPFYRL